MLENISYDEDIEFTKEELESQEQMKETAEDCKLKETSGAAQSVELSEDIKKLSAIELRTLAGNEYAEHAGHSTPLREAYLRLAEMKENLGDNAEDTRETSLGTGCYAGNSAETWLAKAKIAEMEGKSFDASRYRGFAEKAVK